MKRVLVTGADGFIGSHLSEFLVQKGYRVRGLVNYNSFNSWGWLDTSPYAKEMEIVSGDIRDPFFCKTITKEIDVVFHLAALIAIPFSYQAPQSYIETNVNGTANICLGAIENNVGLVIHTSTSEVYGTAKYVPIDENHPLQPQSPYSASKIGADAMAQSFHNSFGLPLITARPFNTYGPRQSARAIIPTIITQMLAGKKTIELGDISPTRDFNFVLDTVLGFYKLFQAEKAVGKCVNIGSNSEISIKDLFEKIKKITNSQCELAVDKTRIRPEKSEVYRLLADNALIKEIAGYIPEFGLDRGLEETVKWFSDPINLKKYKWDIYNV
ncbi:MAG: NAD-dependent 4,6-dehydratase LegB [Bacteriovoracaceae bacterium]|nr:NAD-dependent 4,6-dehydratase LegB [Bacteriovoracaceae bacterium]